MKKETKEKQDVIPFNLPLPKDLHKRIKVQAAKEGKTMKAYCIEAIEDETIQ